MLLWAVTVYIRILYICTIFRIAVLQYTSRLEHRILSVALLSSHAARPVLGSGPRTSWVQTLGSNWIYPTGYILPSWALALDGPYNYHCGYNFWIILSWSRSLKEGKITHNVAADSWFEANGMAWSERERERILHIIQPIPADSMYR